MRYTHSGSLDYLRMLDKPILEKIMSEFDTYDLPTQRALIPLFASTTHPETYVFLFDFLKKTRSRELSKIIEACLIKTTYFIFPLITAYLMDPDTRFIKKLKVVLAGIGLRKIEPYLAMLPDIPNERVFREVFGDEAINQIKS